MFRETIDQRWSLFAGYSGSRSNTYLDDAALPDFLPEVLRSPRSGYLRFGLGGSGLGTNFGWSGNAYLLQGIGAATLETQRRELAVAGISPGEATAIGALASGAWAFQPGWQVNLRLGGQVALRPLSSPMQFTLGSDVGLRGLPGQLISGDSGLLARWTCDAGWLVELGWVEQFSTADNPGVWTDWALGDGLYAKVQYRF